MNNEGLPMRTIDHLVGDWYRVGIPFVKYTATQTALNSIVIACETGYDVSTTTEDTLTNVPCIALTNLIYAKVIDYTTRKYGRFGANVVSFAASAVFYAYARLTNDSDPTIPSAVATGIGLYLTNRHVSRIIGNSEEK